jgi:hypothetical protein
MAIARDLETVALKRTGFDRNDQTRSNAKPIRMGVVVANLLPDRAVGQSDVENVFNLRVRLLS